MHQFRTFLSDNMGSFSPKAIPGFVFGILLVALLAFLLGRLYIRYGNALSNRKAFARNFLLMATTTMFIITVIKSSLALSLGLVGALSIVRFRSAIKEPEELAYLFITIAIGLGVGAGFAVLTVIGFMVICLLIWLSHRYHKPADNQNLYLTISSGPGEKVSIKQVMEVLKEHCEAVKLKRSDETDNTTEASFMVEYESIEALEETKTALRKLNSSISVTFMDNTRDF